MLKLPAQGVVGGEHDSNPGHKLWAQRTRTDTHPPRSERLGEKAVGSCLGARRGTGVEEGDKQERTGCRGTKKCPEPDDAAVTGCGTGSAGKSARKKADQGEKELPRRRNRFIEKEYRFFRAWGETHLRKEECTGSKTTVNCSGRNVANSRGCAAKLVHRPAKRKASRLARVERLR